MDRGIPHERSVGGYAAKAVSEGGYAAKAGSELQSADGKTTAPTGQRLQRRLLP